jgi:hypothetical protein
MSMNETVGRREVLKYAAAVATGTGSLASGRRGQGNAKVARPLKACQYGMLSKLVFAKGWQTADRHSELSLFRVFFAIF